MSGNLVAFHYKHKRGKLYLLEYSRLFGCAKPLNVRDLATFTPNLEILCNHLYFSVPADLTSSRGRYGNQCMVTGYPPEFKSCLNGNCTRKLMEKLVSFAYYYGTTIRS